MIARKKIQLNARMLALHEKSGLPMGRSIRKVDGRDSENLQKKRYAARFMAKPLEEAQKD